MAAPVCTCPEDPEKRSATYTHKLGCEAHAVGCPRWGLPELSIDPAEVEDHPGRRWRGCVEKWPDCASMAYDPSCCRFPKSCSATVVLDEYTRLEELEPVSHHRDVCKHGKLVTQCRCMGPKETRIVPCPPSCAAGQEGAVGTVAEAPPVVAHPLDDVVPPLRPGPAARLCGATHPRLPAERTCQLPAGHGGEHEVNDSMGRVEWFWRDEPQQAFAPRVPRGHGLPATGAPRSVDC